jgi:hypothetical protein
MKTIQKIIKVVGQALEFVFGLVLMATAIVWAYWLTSNLAQGAGYGDWFGFWIITYVGICLTYIFVGAGVAGAVIATPFAEMLVGKAKSLCKLS